jgi:hypothetical protein
VSRTLQTVTGLNFVAGIIAGHVAKHLLRQKLGTRKIDVKVKPYSFTDLCAGKVKAVNIKLERCLVKAIPIGSLRIASANPLWYDPGWHGHKRGLRTAIMFNLNARLDRQQISAALNNPKIASSIRGLKLDLPGLGATQIQILKPNVELSDGMIKINATLVTDGASEDTGVPVTISGRPSIEGAKIFLREMTVASPDIPNPEEFAAFMDELFNPIFDMGRYDRVTHALRLTKVDVQSEIVDGRGTLVLAPKPDVAVAQVEPKRKSFLHLF